MIDFTDKSPQTRYDIRIVLEQLIKATEVKDPKDKFALKIPKHTFAIEHIDYQRALNILNLLSEGNNLFVVLNERLKRLLRESDPLMTGWQSKNEELRRAYFKFNTTQEDLDKYFLIDIKDPNISEKLKQGKNLLDQVLNERDQATESELLKVIPKG